MNSRRANLGQAPSPFDGSFDDFVGLLAFSNTQRPTGDLADRSPEQAYARVVAAG